MEKDCGPCGRGLPDRRRGSGSANDAAAEPAPQAAAAEYAARGAVTPRPGAVGAAKGAEARDEHASPTAAASDGAQVPRGGH